MRRGVDVQTFITIPFTNTPKIAHCSERIAEYFFSSDVPFDLCTSMLCEMISPVVVRNDPIKTFLTPTWHKIWMISERRSEGYDYSIFHFIYLAPALCAILHREAAVGCREKALLNLVTNKSIKIAKTFIDCSLVNDVPIPSPLGSSIPTYVQLSFINTIFLFWCISATNNI